MALIISGCGAHTSRLAGRLKLLIIPRDQGLDLVPAESVTTPPSLCVFHCLRG